VRIGLAIPHFDPRLGGAEQWTWQFAQQLTRLGHEVQVVAKTFHPRAAETGVCAAKLEAGSSRLAFANAAAAAIDRLRLDVVHDMGAGWRCDVFHPHGGSRRAACERNLFLSAPWLRPIKRRLHGSLPRYREFERLSRLQYDGDSRIIIAVSRFVARDLERFHGVRPERICIVYNGVDVDRFSPRQCDVHRRRVRSELGVADRETLLLIVAHNFALKGVPTALAAVGKLARQGHPVRLVVAGGKRTGSAQRMARRLGAGEATIFLGAVDDAAPYYAAADVYVQPTHYDPCSLVALEALASGLPVVTSRFNGVSELMTDGREGAVLLDPADAEELTARLLPLLNRDRRRECGDQGRRLSLAHTLERNCREMLQVYEKILAERGGPRSLSRVA
jgi:UDP-glucose:(heptosyl)LPS alpha-1,3-glucosyltransferase